MNEKYAPIGSPFLFDKVAAVHAVAEYLEQSDAYDEVATDPSRIQVLLPSSPSPPDILLVARERTVGDSRPISSIEPVYVQYIGCVQECVDRAVLDALYMACGLVPGQPGGAHPIGDTYLYLVCENTVSSYFVRLSEASIKNRWPYQIVVIGHMNALGHFVEHTRIPLVAQQD